MSKEITVKEIDKAIKSIKKEELKKLFLNKMEIVCMHTGTKDIILSNLVYTLTIKRNDGKNLTKKDMQKLFSKEIIYEQEEVKE